MKTSSESPREQAVGCMLKAGYAYRGTGAHEPETLWQQDVMRDIRRIGPLNLQTNPAQIFNQLIWRFATAACVLVLFLSVYAGINGWNPLDELNAQFFNNPVEFTVSQAFGVYESYE